MSQASDYLENALLNSLFGKTSDLGALSSVPTIYLALCTAAPNDADTGTTITEANYTSYARKITAAGDWNAAVSGLIDNANDLSFPTATGGSSTCTHFALVDAVTAGNVLCYGTLSSTLVVSTGVTPKFEAGDLDVILS